MVWNPKSTLLKASASGPCASECPKVSVPEVYGWLKDGNRVYIFMELVQGITLEKIWDSLSRIERTQICTQLRSILTELRGLQQDPHHNFIGRTWYVYNGVFLLTLTGDIGRGPLADIVFTNGNLPRGGPFTNVKEFHDWLSSMLTRGMEQHWPGIEPADIPDPYRKGLPEDAAIVFTHADLHPSNILISRQKSHSIVSIIDWQQSAWYPDYWEFCKTESTVVPRSEWVKEYIPQFVDEPACLEAFEAYAKSYGY